MDLTEPAMSMIDGDTYALSYKAAWTARATTRRQANEGAEPDPFGQHLGPQRRQMAGGLPRRERESSIRKAPPPPPAPAAKKEELKKDDKTAAESNTAANTAPPARATPDANTDALVKVELALWKHGRHTTPKSSTI